MMGTSKDSMKEMIVLSFSLCRSSKGYGSFHIDKGYGSFHIDKGYGSFHIDKGYGSFHIDKGKEKKQKNHYLYDSDYARTRSGT